MALVGFPFPYNIENLLVGAVAVLYADPDTVDVPEGIEDIFLPSGVYTPVTGWNYLGATKEAFSYSRAFETEGLEIQQSTSPILEEVTNINRSINVSQAEFSPFGFQLMENAPAPAVVNSTPGVNAPTQDKISFGNFTSLKRYRFAFVSRRPVASGAVLEGIGGKERGRFVVGVAYQSQLTADEITMEQGKGELSAVELAFGLFPETEDAQPEGEELGAWFLERAGTLTIA